MAARSMPSAKKREGKAHILQLAVLCGGLLGERGVEHAHAVQAQALVVLPDPLQQRFKASQVIA